MASEQSNYRRKASQRKPLAKDPFRSTTLWNQIVGDFRERMFQCLANSSASNRNKRFSGTEAVERLTGLLKEKQQKFGFKDVTEEKAIKMCEIFFRDNIIAAADVKCGNRFQMSKTAFYYFTSSSKSSSPLSVEKELDRSAMTPLNAVQSRLAVSSPSPSSTSSFDDIDERLVYDFALARLLTLVEIPILEGILQMRSDFDGNSVFKNLENLFRNMKMSRSRNDPWPDLSSGTEAPSTESDLDDGFTAAAYRCLRCCQKTNSAQSGTLYRVIIDTYKSITSKRGCLVPRQFVIVLDEISCLIVGDMGEGKIKALEACQNLYMLLPKERRDQFASLLELLISIRDMKTPPTDFMVAKETIQAFVLPKEASCVCQLFDFMLENAQTILAYPNTFYQQFSDYDDTEATPGITFCMPITPEEYGLQARTATEQALFDLLWSVVNRHQMGDKEKRLWLEEFRKAYPDVYEASFRHVK